MIVAAIERVERTLVSSVTVVETRMVVHARRGQRAVVLVDDLLRLPLLCKGADFAETDIARAVGRALATGGAPSNSKLSGFFSW